MAYSYLNERTKNIINVILKQSDVLTIKNLSEEFSVSTRTIYKELAKANEWLNDKGLPEIEIIRGKIQPFAEVDRSMFDKVLNEDQTDDYIFTPSERVKIIICKILLASQPIYVEDLMNTCDVSRNTIFTDLQVVISQLNMYHLELLYEKKSGYYISGNVIRKRALFFLCFNMLEPLFSANKLNFIYKSELENNLSQLKKVEEELQAHYVYNDMLALAAMIPVMENNKDKLTFSNMSIEKVCDSKEFQIVEKYFPKLSYDEKIYLSLHFLGGRLSSYSDIVEDEYLLEIAKNLVSEFERIGCVTFKNKEELIHNLYHHINASIYRYQYGIQIGNPMADDIKREYPYLFDTMKEVSRYLEQQIGVQISDSEIAYLSLHFGAHMENAKHQEQQLRILVACMNGVATGNMISHELQRILPQAKIVGVIAASHILNPQNICDIIISSVKLNTVVPVIVVNPILNDFDRKNILDHPLIRSKFGFVDMDALYQVIKKYVPEKEHVALKKELRQFFNQNQEEQMVLKPDVWRLTDFLTEDRIIFLDHEGYDVRDRDMSYETLEPWQRSLYSVAKPLIKRKSISNYYVQCIIDRCIEAGPYMFVTKDLILAHARPGNGVKHLDLAIGLAKEPIEFMGGKKARIVFLLVVEDQQKHMGILQDIRKSLAKKAFVDDLMLASEPKTICKILLNKLGVE